MLLHPSPFAAIPRPCGREAKEKMRKVKIELRYVPKISLFLRGTFCLHAGDI
jgi:hypothetical protein